MEAVNNLLKELGRHIGLEQLALDEEGQCTLAFDEDIVVTFVADPDGGLNAVSFVGELPESGAEPFVKGLLEENFLQSNHGGARFAIEPNSSRVVMVGRWDAQKTDIGLLSSQLEACVNTIDAMQKTMSATKFDEAAPVEKKSGGDYIPPAGATFA
jgi:hypothetical protein